jgi:hypothetical protein
MGKDCLLWLEEYVKYNHLSRGVKVAKKATVYDLHGLKYYILRSVFYAWLKQIHVTN